MRGTLQALAFCHERSVGHGSMGSGSILLSTYDDRRANDLIVKLDNFGFGRAHYACSLDLRGGMNLCQPLWMVQQCSNCQFSAGVCNIKAMDVNAGEHCLDCCTEVG